MRGSILLIASSLLTSLSSIGVDKVFSYEITSEEIVGNLKPYTEEVDVPIHIVNRSSFKNISFTCTTNIYNLANVLLCSNSQTFTSLATKETDDILKIQFENYLTSNGVIIELEFFDVLNFTKTSSKFTLFPISLNQWINLDSYVGAKYNTLPTSFRLISASEVETYVETYDLREFNNYFDVNSYHTLPIDCFHLYYDYVGLDYEYEKASLIVENCDSSFFPYSRDVDNNVEINLKVTQEDHKLTFEYNDKLYVNPIDLTMSLNQQIGFVKTNSIFLPINHKDEIIDTNFYLKLKNSGHFAPNLLLNLHFTSVQNYIGSCNDSEYCVTGGVNK